jgi:hypothetical protein
MHHVTENSHNSYNVADMSPDDSRLTYMRWHVDGVKMAVYVSSKDGLHERRIAPPGLEAWSPDWSPTGSRIAFASYVFFDRPAPALFTVRPDGSGLTALTHPPFPHSDTWPAYSPNGAKVIFQSDRGYDDFCCDDLFIVSASGGSVTQVQLPFDAYEPRWGTAPIKREAATASAATTTTAKVTAATMSAARVSATQRPGDATGGSPCATVPALALVERCGMAGPTAHS